MCHILDFTHKWYHTYTHVYIYNYFKYIYQVPKTPCIYIHKAKGNESSLSNTSVPHVHHSITHHSRAMEITPCLLGGVWVKKWTHRWNITRPPTRRNPGICDHMDEPGGPSMKWTGQRQTTLYDLTGEETLKRVEITEPESRATVTSGWELGDLEAADQKPPTFSSYIISLKFVQRVCLFPPHTQRRHRVRSRASFHGICTHRVNILYTWYTCNSYSWRIPR